MIAIFALIVCMALGAPWWVYLVGFVLLLLDC